jgi:two-component system, LytTR family, sensor kinase
MMQPLVENAIRHGISKRRESGTVTVSARRENDLLRISVEDDGVGLPADWRPGASEGLGLSVTSQRVTALDTPAATAGFTIGARAGGGTRVDITLPYRVESASSPTPALAPVPSHVLGPASAQAPAQASVERVVAEH